MFPITMKLSCTCRTHASYNLPEVAIADTNIIADAYESSKFTGLAIKFTGQVSSSENSLNNFSYSKRK